MIFILICGTMRISDDQVTFFSCQNCAGLAAILGPVGNVSDNNSERESGPFSTVLNGTCRRIEWVLPLRERVRDG